MQVCYICLESASSHAGSTYVQLTRSTSSVLVATGTSARVSVHSVSASASMLTRMAGTFVDVCNENMHRVYFDMTMLFSYHTSNNLQLERCL